MSHQKQVCIWCDGNDCTMWIRYDTTDLAEATQLARNDGWTSSVWGEHRCPECSQ